MNVDILVKVSGNARSIPVVILEHFDYNFPLKLTNGEWSGIQSNFYVDTDKKLDYAMVISGSSRQKYEVSITVKYGNNIKTKENTGVFGPKGWAIVKDNIEL